MAYNTWETELNKSETSLPNKKIFFFCSSVKRNLQTVKKSHKTYFPIKLHDKKLSFFLKKNMKQTHPEAKSSTNF